MFKAIPVIAALAIAAATPALAQQQYPSDNSTTTSQPSSREESEEQARTPETDERSSGSVETLRDRSMSSPNVKGEAVPENPATGVPDPSGRGDPRRLESVPRP
ncbi:MAG: hypothetical protein H7Y60_04080 [Rhodospirillaceae bacterium]|nr:hypothetical protein [Rhodospirillales bacterium]